MFDDFYFEYTKKGDLLAEWGAWCRSTLASKHARDVYSYCGALSEFLGNRDLITYEVASLINDLDFADLEKIKENEGLCNSNKLCTFLSNYYSNKLFDFCVFDKDFQKIFAKYCMHFEEYDLLPDDISNILQKTDCDFDTDDLQKIWEELTA